MFYFQHISFAACSLLDRESYYRKHNYSSVLKEEGNEVRNLDLTSIDFRVILSCVSNVFEEELAEQG